MTEALRKAIQDTKAQIINAADGTYYRVEGEFDPYTINAATNMVRNARTKSFICIVDGEEKHEVKTTEDGTIARLYALHHDKKFISKIATLAKQP